MEKLTDEESYQQKCEWLALNSTEADLDDFYRDLFPAGSFERTGHREDQKPNGILTVIRNYTDENGIPKEWAKNEVVLDELWELMKLQTKSIEEDKSVNSCVLSPIGYVGKHKNAKNARVLYALAFDLDGVGMRQLQDLFFQMENEVLPRCTYCVNSGHGLHLYYLLEKPIELFPRLHKPLNDLKHDLTAKIWNQYTSTYKKREEVQYQSIFQSFRIVGTLSKLGWSYPVRAFKTGERVTLGYLNEFVINPENKINEDLESYKWKPGSGPSGMTLEEAKEAYPEWYQKRVVEGKAKGCWKANRGLYDWWYKQIKTGATVGHRYHCLCILAIYASKCKDVHYEELERDCYELREELDRLTDDSHNRFTKNDVRAALKFYSEDRVRVTRAWIERQSGIPIQKNKRNGRKRPIHIKYMNLQKEFKAELGECTMGGRPTKKDTVLWWRKLHPDGSKADCTRDTGLARNTVYKWWNAEPTPPEIEITTKR